MRHVPPGWPNTRRFLPRDRERHSPPPRPRRLRPGGPLAAGPRRNLPCFRHRPAVFPRLDLGVHDADREPGGSADRALQEPLVQPHPAAGVRRDPGRDRRVLSADRPGHPHAPRRCRALRDLALSLWSDGLTRLRVDPTGGEFPRSRAFGRRVPPAAGPGLLRHVPRRHLSLVAAALVVLLHVVASRARGGCFRATAVGSSSSRGRSSSGRFSSFSRSPSSSWASRASRR